MKTAIESAQMEIAQDDKPPDSAMRRDSEDSRPALINAQRAVRADWSKFSDFLVKIQTEFSCPPFGVRLVTDRSIRRFNKQYRGQDTATDVLSFPAEGGAGTGGYLGDILISVETARANTARFGVSLDEELMILALHGVLHLMGYDHETDRGEMARLEAKWRRKLGLSTGLIARASARPSRAAAKGRR